MIIHSLPLSALEFLFQDWIIARVSQICEHSSDITESIQALETKAKTRADYIGIPWKTSYLPEWYTDSTTPAPTPTPTHEEE